MYLFQNQASVYGALVFSYPFLLFKELKTIWNHYLFCFFKYTHDNTHKERSLMLQEAVYFPIAPIGDGTGSPQYRHVLLTSFHSRTMTTNLKNKFRESQLIAILSVSSVHFPVYSRYSAKCKTREKEKCVSTSLVRSKSTYVEANALHLISCNTLNV